MTGTRVLIVEDEALFAMALEADIADLGHTVCGIVDTARGALDAARSLKPDLVLMDLRLKGQADGADAAEWIWAELPGTRVVFLTGSLESRARARIGRGRPDGVLYKPIPSGSLRHVLERAGS